MWRIWMTLNLYLKQRGRAYREKGKKKGGRLAALVIAIIAIILEGRGGRNGRRKGKGAGIVCFLLFRAHAGAQGKEKKGRLIALAAADEGGEKKREKIYLFAHCGERTNSQGRKKGRLGKKELLFVPKLFY